jgi:hypothetical protein
MEKREIIANMRIVHALFNVTILMFLIFQAWLGLKIRRRRKAGDPPAFNVIKTHRKLGPVLVLAGVLGYVSGCVIIYFDTGNLFKFPWHSSLGLTLALLLTAVLLVSKKITGADSPWRTIHYLTGLLILCIYCVQAFIGIGILF